MDQLFLSTINYYSPWCDVAVIAICCVIVILLLTSYVSHNRTFYIFQNILCTLVIAALLNIIYHKLPAVKSTRPFSFIYILRILYHTMLFDVFFLFTLYTTEVVGMEKKKKERIAFFSAFILIVFVLADIIATVTGTGFQILEDGTTFQRTNLFMVGYIVYVVMLAILIGQVKNMIFKHVIYGFYGTMIIAVLVRFGQVPLHQSSLTTMTFLFPVIGMLYIIHSNPYNVALGTVDTHAIEDMVREMYAAKEAFIFSSLLLPEYNLEGKVFPEDIQAQVRRFSAEYFKGCVLFQIGNGHVVLIAPRRKNPDYEARTDRMLADFNKLFRLYHMPYKIVMGNSIDEISRKNEYISLIRDIQKNIPDNTIHRVNPEDVERFNKKEYILDELTDIYKKRDPDDPRVLAFCQPVYNLKTGKFDTAEALMRLKLDKAGMVFPDQFIYLAEDHGYIHVLTEIILHKTSREINRLIKEGYQIVRISVNVSVLELKDEYFCTDINRIIRKNMIPGEKIAIELTESRSESDFMIMKEKIEELHQKGIKFYLDDFGTGYSNMERIMELPFDIIKFDRSLLIASGTDERSEKIVENLAHMFKDMEYSVLYEGVEDDTDEERCIEMSASYLQGYKYSRPVPIERLRDFLYKEEACS